MGWVSMPKCSLFQDGIDKYSWMTVTGAAGARATVAFVRLCHKGWSRQNFWTRNDAPMLGLGPFAELLGMCAAWWCLSSCLR